MASITKTAAGWRAQVYVKGIRESQCFSTKTKASTWAAMRETELRQGAETGVRSDKTLGDAFTRYADEVSIHKRGSRWELIRLKHFAAYEIDGKPLGAFKIGEVTPDLLGRWRNQRLTEVSPSTFNRDMNLLSNVFTVARREWKWIAVSPTRDVRRPKEGESRRRLVSAEEIAKLAHVFGYHGKVLTKTHRVYLAFLFAIETAMRAGEICNLEWRHIYEKKAHLPQTKNGTRRDVPLSKPAQALLAKIPKGEPQDKVFGLTSGQLDALWRKYRDMAGINDLHFHDTRHEAITRLSKKLNVLELAAMVGHKDLRQLQVYYNESAENIADRL